MSFGRKTYDGDLLRRHSSSTERRNPVGGKSKINKSSSPKRTIKNDEFLAEESPFVESGEKDRYLITYADLITLLLGLFIILYTISKVDAGKYEKIISAMGDVFGTHPKITEMTSANNIPVIKPFNGENILKAELSRIIDQNHYDKSIKLEENDRGIVIHILDEILFPSGSANLNAGSLVILNKIASILKKLPNDIRVEGHTDNVPIHTEAFPSNWHLSIARALNTAYYLINSEGLMPDKVSIVGYSEYKPIDSNNTPEGRANNRRVDIVILKSKNL
jgi:chemotaxis protein MotB